jgi:hypothetical protein
MATNKIRPASKKTNQKSSCINLDLKHQCVKIVKRIFSNMNGHVLSNCRNQKAFQQKKNLLTKRIKIPKKIKGVLEQRTKNT